MVGVPSDRVTAFCLFAVFGPWSVVPSSCRRRLALFRPCAYMHLFSVRWSAVGSAACVVGGLLLVAFRHVLILSAVGVRWTFRACRARIPGPGADVHLWSYPGRSGAKKSQGPVSDRAGPKAVSENVCYSLSRVCDGAFQRIPAKKKSWIPAGIPMVFRPMAQVEKLFYQSAIPMRS